ncbi:hypothetical protein CEXT_475291 [Caerostris extrusa]|uniref:Uncharacterized protein n=1 Tax=Caerostris extrusa TaxID=172846 RepID=A0AAV4SUJ5_CAEEX|nr:hypothetical protein CEXT_475291 [Caerostris extrusa]
MKTAKKSILLLKKCGISTYFWQSHAISAPKSDYLLHPFRHPPQKEAYNTVGHLLSPLACPGGVPYEDWIVPFLLRKDAFNQGNLSLSSTFRHPQNFPDCRIGRERMQEEIKKKKKGKRQRGRERKGKIKEGNALQWRIYGWNNTCSECRIRLFHGINGFLLSPNNVRRLQSAWWVLKDFLINKCSGLLNPGCLSLRFRQMQNNEATAHFAGISGGAGFELLQNASCYCSA